MPTIVTSTVGTSADYATLELWEAGEAANLVTADEISRAAMLNEEHTDPFIFNNGAWNTDLTRYAWIDADDGAQHDGTRGSGARLNWPSGNIGINVNVNGEVFHVTRLEFTTSGSSGSLTAVHINNSGSFTAVDGCLIYDMHSSSACQGIVGTDESLDIFNNNIFDIEGYGIRLQGSVDPCRLYNNTIWCNNSGSRALYIDENIEGEQDVDMRNCLMHGAGEALGGDFASAGKWSTSCDQNIVNDTSGTDENLPGTVIESATFQAGTGGAGTRVMFISLTAGSEDFHIEDDDNNSAVEFGNNLTAEVVPSNIFLIQDIDRVERPDVDPWDAGSDQLTIVIPPSLMAPAYGTVTTLPPTAYGGEGIPAPAYFLF